MALVDLWQSSRSQLEDKSVTQIIGFAGDGRLRDGSDTSQEFRDFLSAIPSGLLAQYAGQCLTTHFDNGGLALQDIVNQIGKRLGFAVTNGRYRGVRNEVGFDGIWRSADDYAIVVEVKTTDAYRIELETLATYRRSLIQEGTLTEERSSILIVCGRWDTGDLEAQIRGSRQAWDTRLISVDSLLRLLAIKEELEDPATVRRIRDVLIPHEFTRIDGIIDLVFAAAEEVRQGDTGPVPADSEVENGLKPGIARFNDACIKRIEAHLHLDLVRRTQVTYASPDDRAIVICAVSREHHDSAEGNYWFAFHPHQKELISSAETGIVAFGCGSADLIVLVSAGTFLSWLDGMNVTSRQERSYWHVSIFRESGRLTLHRRRGYPIIDLAGYTLPGGEDTRD